MWLMRLCFIFPFLCYVLILISALVFIASTDFKCILIGALLRCKINALCVNGMFLDMWVFVFCHCIQHSIPSWLTVSPIHLFATDMLLHDFVSGTTVRSFAFWCFFSIQQQLVLKFFFFLFLSVRVFTLLIWNVFVNYLDK